MWHTVRDRPSGGGDQRGPDLAERAAPPTTPCARRCGTATITSPRSRPLRVGLWLQPATAARVRSVSGFSPNWPNGAASPSSGSGTCLVPRSITDMRDRIIFIPDRGGLKVRQARSVVLQTLGHFALDHSDTRDFGDYLRQRIESNYFAAAVLAPEGPAVEFCAMPTPRRTSPWRTSRRCSTSPTRWRRIVHEPGDPAPRDPLPLPANRQRGSHRQGLRERRGGVPTAIDGGHEGERVPASGVRAKRGTPPAASCCIRSTR